MSLCFFLVLCLLIEVLGGKLTDTSVATWYYTLQKPIWNPPNWLFGLVWTLLYICIAISGWLIFIKPPSKKRIKALFIYAAQLLFNLLWSFLFFFLQSPLLGLLDIALLLIFIFMTIGAFWSLSRLAAYLLIPYFAWTLYAATLNGAIWILNLNS